MARVEGGKRRRPVPRGSVAVMTAIVLPVMLAMFAFTLVLGYLVDSRNRLNAAGNCLAATYAEQALVLPYQFWQQQPDVATLGAANGVPQGSFSQTAMRAFLTTPVGVNRVDAWAPAVVQVDTAYAGPAAGLAALSTVFLRSSVGTMAAQHSARISQLQLGKFSMARERVMFVLDYSKSMRLHYDGLDSNPTGLEVMRETGSQVASNFSGVFDAGVLLFSGGRPGDTKDMALLGSTKQAASGGTPANQNTHINEMSDLINSTGTMGNGTDLAAAITTAQAMLHAASADTSSVYSNQRMIIITDGEPDVIDGYSSDSEPYAMRVKAAELQAQKAMSDVWANEDTTAQVIFMTRTQPDLTILQGAETFLQSLAGSRTSRSDPNNLKNNYHTDAKDYGEILRWLLAQPTYPLCVSDPIDQGSVTPPVPTGLLPSGGEMITAWFDMSSAGYPGEQQVAHVMYGAAQKQNFLDATKQVGATFSPGGSSAFNLEPLLNPDNLIVWYDDDPASHRVYLSPMMCAALFSAQNNGQQMRLRLRWGSPRPVLRGREALDISGRLGL